jgi:hypothetical protein
MRRGSRISFRPEDRSTHLGTQQPSGVAPCSRRRTRSRAPNKSTEQPTWPRDVKPHQAPPYIGSSLGSPPFRPKKGRKTR